MKLELKENYAVLNETPIYIKEITPVFLIKLINANPRIEKLDMGVSIYIFDNLGIRFWERNNRVYECEFLLIKTDDEKSPQEIFEGEIFLNDSILVKPILIDKIKSVEGIKITQDEDSLRFGMNIYHIFLGNRRYSFWVDKDDEKVTSVHI